MSAPLRLVRTVRTELEVSPVFRGLTRREFGPMYVAKKDSAVLLVFPKCASQSSKATVGIRPLVHKDQIGGPVVFIVRNHFERLISTYWDKVVCESGSNNPTFNHGSFRIFLRAIADGNVRDHHVAPFSFLLRIAIGKKPSYFSDAHVVDIGRPEVSTSVLLPASLGSVRLNVSSQEKMAFR